MHSRAGIQRTGQGLGFDLLVAVLPPDLKVLQADAGIGAVHDHVVRRVDLACVRRTKEGEKQQTP